MTACKKLKRDKNITIEDLYQNKNFVPPKEQNLETIFEEPKQAKDGAPIMTSVRKYKRYLNFDPITGKVHKAKKKSKRFEKKIKGKTRSASKTVQNIDISVVLETLKDSSDECDVDMTISKCRDEDPMANDSSNLPIKGENCKMARNNMSVFTIYGKTINDNDQKGKKSKIPFTKTVNSDHETTDETTNDVLCEKCTLVENLCSCEILRLNKGRKSDLNKTVSSLKCSVNG